MGTINELNTTDTLADDDKLVLWKTQAGATRAITAEDAATYFSLAGGPYQPLDELLTAIAGLGPSTAAGDFIELTAQDTVRVRKLSVATYAALTVIPASFRFDDMLVYVASRATDGDGGEGWWRFNAASSASANGGTILAPDAGTGRWIRLYEAGQVYADWFGVTKGTTSGTVPADNSTAINAAMAQCAADGGGHVYVSCLATSYISVGAVVDNIYNNVLVVANTQYSIDSNGGTNPRYGVTLVPTAAITVLKRRSPFGASNPRTNGGGFKGFRVIGNSVATKLLEVTSVWGYEIDLHLEECVGAAAAEFIAAVTGTDIADDANIQRGRIRLSVRQSAVGAARSAHCVRLIGSSNANFSMNSNVELDLVHYDGHALVGDGDANTFSFFRTFRITGGTGLSIYGEGRTAAVPVGFESNTFYHFSVNTAGYLEGTGDAGVTAAVFNQIFNNDVGNNSQRPTAGTGSAWRINDTKGREFGMRGVGAAFGADGSEADLAAAGVTSTTASYFYNGSNDHMVLATSVGVWKIFVDASTGDMTFTRISGSGELVLPALVKIFSKSISEGAADSGGAGFKVLRVPN